MIFCRSPTVCLHLGHSTKGHKMRLRPGEGPQFNPDMNMALHEDFEYRNKFCQTFWDCFAWVKQSLIFFVVLGAFYVLIDRYTDNYLNNYFFESPRATCPASYDNNYAKPSAGLRKNEKSISVLKEEISYLRDKLYDLEKLWDSINWKSEKCPVDKVDEIKSVVNKIANVDNKIESALEKYHADTIGMFDYAAKYAGGEVCDTPDTTPYPSKQFMQIFGIFKFSTASKPDELITPEGLPGNCFAFYGQEGSIIIKLGQKIKISGVTLEHVPKTLVEDYTSAPKDFEVWGLQDCNGLVKQRLGTFTYSMDSNKYIQTFNVPLNFLDNEMFQYVQLKILNNHGNEYFTCVYRFRVHSKTPSM